jgi:hypothetical protein
MKNNVTINFTIKHKIKKSAQTVKTALRPDFAIAVDLEQFCGL